MTLPPEDVRFCNTCGELLNRFQMVGSPIVDYLHGGQQPGQAHGHRADPVRLEQLGREPVIKCDICSGGAAWVYVCDDQQSHFNQIVSEQVGHADYARRHGAARVIRTVTERRRTDVVGDRWAACDTCADLIERRDLLGLIGRGIETISKARSLSGNRLIRARGQLYGLYEHVLTTLKPGRGQITREHPMGVWDDPSPQPT